MKFGLLKKFWLLTGVFGVILLLVIGVIFNISQDNSQLVERDTPVLNKSHELKLTVVQVQQYLTDISATRGQDGLNDGFKLAEENALRFRQLIIELEKLAPENKAIYESIRSAFEAYYTVGVSMAKAYVAEGPSGGNKMMGDFDKTAVTISKHVDELLEKSKANTHALLQHEQSQLNTTRNIILAATLSLGGIMLVIFFLLSRALKILPVLGDQMQRIATGDLGGTDLECQRNDEIGVLVTQANQMKQGLRLVISRVATASNELLATVNKLSDIVRTTEHGMQQQQTEVQQAATAMHEMSATANEVARNAVTVADSSKAADQESAVGSKVVNQTISMIDTLAVEVEKAADVIHKLEDESASIGKILDVIRGVAEQTNLLALNAAIEAARAGEQGRGFAVVADEVRTLAGRTQTSTQEIQEVIKRLQTTAAEAVNVMNQSRSQAQDSVNQVKQAGEKLGLIIQKVSAITEMNNQIASAANEQSSVAEEISRNITNINTISDQTSSNSRELASANNQLGNAALDLRDMVSQFKI